ncbi:hypothetical protein [Tsukamurella pseudospumae]|uniref:DNA-binding protein n=1 Tax=Tsukamurella pseudospumae TaxID=239498 RepID=A0A137ZR99_9ACTN|nr:hypothetical protein [Tsukamurella pseudospumae]KXP00708.1 hypothetical protein AXK61_14485 [Tsukamurella pseudospumae]
MPSYSYILRIEAIEPDDDRLDALADVVDDVVFASRAGLASVTLVVESVTSRAAGIDAVRAARAAGLVPLRTIPDLVDRREISERVGVTRQAVGNWARGDRQGTTDFPAPYAFVSGEIWLWHDVAAWLRESGVFDEDLETPDWSDLIATDRWIADDPDARAPSDRFASEPVATGDWDFASSGYTLSRDEAREVAGS